MTADRAVDRLPEDLRFKLDNIAASWEMEGQDLSADELDVLARYLLGEVPEHQVARLLDELG